MGRFASYPFALLWGFYYYIFFQLIYLWRFGSINFRFGLLDFFLPVIGILSVMLLFFFANKLAAKQRLLLIPFVVALPPSVIGALLGGLFGPLGLVLFGAAPFAIALPIGYWFIKKFAL